MDAFQFKQPAVEKKKSYSPQGSRTRLQSQSRCLSCVDGTTHQHTRRNDLTVAS